MKCTKCKVIRYEDCDEIIKPTQTTDYEEKLREKAEDNKWGSRAGGLDN